MDYVLMQIALYLARLVGWVRLLPADWIWGDYQKYNGRILLDQIL